MNTLSIQEFKKEIISYFTKNSGLTISEAKKQIKAKMNIDEYDNSVKIGNVRVFRTVNKNFAGGKANGYGAGWYITNAGKTYIRL